MTLRRFRFDKLVRDGIPQLLADKGMQVELLELEDSMLALKTKLGEESLELMAATDAQLHEELADVLEVLHALAERVGLSWEHLEAIRQQKRAKRGGFGDLAFITTVDIATDNPEIETYLKRPLDFPQEPLD